MRRALAEYQVVGVRTTLPFARWLMHHARFIAGDLSTDFVAEEWDTRNVGAVFAVDLDDEDADLAGESETAPGIDQVAALVGGLLANEHMEAEKLRRRPAGETNGTMSRWREVGRREALR
jgi:acetyl/propionyl-CoA carboxylase alpha subunit